MSVKGDIICKLFEALTYIVHIHKGEALFFILMRTKKGAIENIIVEVGCKKGDPKVRSKTRAFDLMPSDIALQSVRQVDLQALP